MEFLFSNTPPMATESTSFYDAFYDLTENSNQMDIAVGYITADSLAQLRRTVDLNNIDKLCLIIGMHYFEQFTKVEYDTAIDLNNYLMGKGKGEVRLANAFRFHGKLYLYSNLGKPFAGIIGSNNLSGISKGGNQSYEASLLIDDSSLTKAMETFINSLKVKATKNIRDLSITRFKKRNYPLQNQPNVEEADPNEFADIWSHKTSTTFNIPLKDAPRSNLNVHFGKGRENSHTGVITPRHWYEIEIIVPKKITSLKGYPITNTPNAVFNVITDDGYKFKCNVSGDYSKNFRSEGDLKILGKWIKGRLENSGALIVGEPVTKETFQRYGRDNFTMTKMDVENLWYLDFSVK